MWQLLLHIPTRYAQKTQGLHVITNIYSVLEFDVVLNFSLMWVYFSLILFVIIILADVK